MDERILDVCLGDVVYLNLIRRINMKTTITVKFSNGTEFEMEADECNFEIKQKIDPVYDAGGLVEYRLGDKTMTLTAIERCPEKTVPALIEPAKLKKVEAEKELTCPDCGGMIAHVVECPQTRKKKLRVKRGIPRRSNRNYCNPEADLIGWSPW